MRSVEFRQFLQAQNLSQNGINSRVNWCNRVERDFNINLDELCIEEEIQNLRRMVYQHEGYTERQRRNFPNALRKYYQFCTGMDLHRLE